MELWHQGYGFAHSAACEPLPLERDAATTPMAGFCG